MPIEFAQLGIGIANGSEILLQLGSKRSQHLVHRELNPVTRAQHRTRHEPTARR